jgi:hypothetical protein
VDRYHGGEDDPVNLVTMALVNENIDNYKEALEKWKQLRSSKSQEGCERTVAILKKTKDLNYIKEYGSWVLLENPQIGMTLFTGDQAGEQPTVDMNPDEVIAFLQKLVKDHPGKEDQFPYLEYYFEYLINHQKTPDSYFT